MITKTQRKVIGRSQDSVAFFLRNFVKTKHPSAGIIPFHPFKYQIKALKVFRSHRFSIFRKCRQCFSGDNMVWGPNGPQRIDMVKPGDLIYSYDERTGMLVSVPVTEVFDNGEMECVAVSSKTGHRSIATKDHKYYTYSGPVEAEVLDRGDTLLEVNDYERHGVDVSESKAVLLGYLITDGHYGKRIHFTNTRWKYLLDFKKHLMREFGVDGKITTHARDDDGKPISWRIWVNGPEVREWIRALGIFGQIKVKKILPLAVFRWSNKSLSIFLNRMFAGDGWYSGSHCNELGMGLESLLALNQVKQLLSRFGVNSTVYSATNTSMPKLRSYGSTSFRNFVEHIGIFGKEPNCKITKGFFFNRRKGEVKSVKERGTFRVYDIRVPPHNNYIVDGAVVHNSGASKISGAFALWFAMMFTHKTVLIVSRRDEDAITFLSENIIFPFRHLPQWMQDLWAPVKDNEHEIQFPNGSKIKSLTSHPDVLRSNASSLNIIDEAAFIRDMGVMWAAGYPTLQHGGSVIVVSTTNGVGDWYWSTWADAEAGLNDFHPITINWWDMDWTISYKDALSGNKRSISPTDRIRKCTTPEEIDKYGPFWSPWLEEQYRALQERGETWKFKQEILADFVGSGNTVLDPRVLRHLTTCINDEFKIIKGEQQYVHPVKQRRVSINFTGDSKDPRPDEGLWIWRPPNYGRPQQVSGKRITDPGVPPHRYIMGVDIATGKGQDYFGAEVFDLDEMEQCAELMVHCLPRQFKFMVDYLGRWYNNAMMVVERNNGGDAFIDELRYELMYPNLWRKQDINDKPTSSTRKQAIQVATYGFMTTMASKPKLNKTLIDNLRVDETGWKIYSRRLIKQLQIYVRKKDRSGRDTNKTEAEDGPGNFDDLVISAALAFAGIHEAMSAGSSGLVPFMPSTELHYVTPQEPSVEDKLADLIAKAGGADPAFLIPMTGVETIMPDLSIAAELQKFTQQVGAIPIAAELPNVSAQKHGFGKR